VRKVAVGLLCSLVSGCLPYYGPFDEDGLGYRETELSPRIYQVEYLYGERLFFVRRGPRYEELALLRAADLTRERGFRYFIVDPTALLGTSLGAQSLIIKLFREAPSAQGVVVFDADEISRKLRARYPYLTPDGP